MQLKEIERSNSSGVEVDTNLSARVVLQPIAAPSILGLYGFAGATFIVAANQAGWYGNDHSAIFLAPFAAFFGGLAQFLAGMWSYRARDGLATAMHGMWGAFWMEYNREANRPGAVVTRPIQLSQGQPGVRVGQQAARRAERPDIPDCPLAQGIGEPERPAAPISSARRRGATAYALPRPDEDRHHVLLSG
jgi:hypothetical protein